MKKPSASLAVSTLALAVALTGTASATGLIDGRSIRDHSIPASKLIAHSLTTKQVKAHSLTKLALDPNAVTIVNNVNAPAGPKGDPGASGANGVAVVDPAKLVVAVSGDITDIPGGTRVNTQAICPAGTYVVGGGNTEVPYSANSQVSVTGSAPYLVGGVQGWEVTVRNYAGTSQTGAWHVVAYCAPAA